MNTTQTGFDALRQRYPVFRYESYAIRQEGEEILLSFRFSIPGLCVFTPQTHIPIAQFVPRNPISSTLARRIVFALGLVEAISYWKCACPSRFIVDCGVLSDWDKAWWKTLWFHGLGEFFYRNGIQTDIDSFLTLESKGEALPDEKEAFHCADLQLIPIGGGKDSCVSMDLLKSQRERNYFFTVNDQAARRDCVLAGGYTPERIVRTIRKIDPELLARNREGFLNGHTPFSAIVAFLSYYCAWLIGADAIVLSNESSANEGNLGTGAQVNHQYSKSYAFERDFSVYAARHFSADIHYFSLLRPWNELQIAQYFARLPQYHAVFKSCNVGSGKNSWCAACAKCLFVYCMLSPFLSRQELQGIFGENLFENTKLAQELDALCGFSPVKPFECVGTAQEVCTALALCAEKEKEAGLAPQPLLRRFLERSVLPQESWTALLREWNGQHHIPKRFQTVIKEMESLG